MSTSEVVKKVWGNDNSRRYIPRARNPDTDHSWQIWDQKAERWVKDHELWAINPDEPLKPN